MKITENKAKYTNNGRTIKQEVTYSDLYQKVKETLVRKTSNPNQAVVTGVAVKDKR